MEATMGYRGFTIYTDNDVTDELIDAVISACKEHEWVHVSFDVTGRTRHVCLATELWHKLGEGYIAVIDYGSYRCKITNILNKPYRDIETNEVLTLKELLDEYNSLKASNDTEAETFNDYLSNCLEGTLEEVK